METPYIQKTLNNVSFEGKLKSENINQQLIYLHLITFELTQRCNLACLYCSYGKYYIYDTDRENQDMPFDYIKQTIDYVVRYKDAGSSLHIGFYGGEPLLRMGLIKATVEYTKKIDLNFTYGLTTNAVLLHKYVSYFAENNFQLLISLDGNKEAHSFRIFPDSTNSFDIVYRNIKILKEKYPEYFERNVIFNAVLHQRNTVEGIKKFIKTKFNKDPMIVSVDTESLNPLYSEEFMRKLYKNEFKSIKSYKTIEGQVQQNPALSRTFRFFKNMNLFFINDYNDVFYEKKEGAEIHWGDETGVKNSNHHGRSYAPKGMTPVKKSMAKKFSINMISTVTNKGKVEFMIYSGSMNADRLIEFIQQLIKNKTKKLFLILDN